MPKFEKGQSGNPAGRRRGTGHAAKLRKAIEADVQDIVRALVEAAKNGDTSASKLLLDRVIPCLKPIQLCVPISGLKGNTLSDQGVSIIEAMGSGKLTPEQAQNMLTALANLSRIREVDDMEKRLAALELQNDN